MTQQRIGDCIPRAAHVGHHVQGRQRANPVLFFRLTMNPVEVVLLTPEASLHRLVLARQLDHRRGLDNVRSREGPFKDALGRFSTRWAKSTWRSRVRRRSVRWHGSRHPSPWLSLERPELAVREALVQLDGVVRGHF